MNQQDCIDGEHRLRSLGGILRGIGEHFYSGAIAVFHQDDADHYRKIEDFHVQYAVHTLAVDLKTHRVYTPEQEEDSKPVALMVVYEAVTNP